MVLKPIASSWLCIIILTPKNINNIPNSYFKKRNDPTTLLRKKVQQSKLHDGKDIIEK